MIARTRETSLVIPLHGDAGDEVSRHSRHCNASLSMAWSRLSMYQKPHERNCPIFSMNLRVGGTRPSVSTGGTFAPTLAQYGGAPGGCPPPGLGSPTGCPRPGCQETRAPTDRSLKSVPPPQVSDGPSWEPTPADRTGQKKTCTGSGHPLCRPVVRVFSR